MKISKKQIGLKECLDKEWLITNGLGGFSSSTVIGLNTRRYHGLLIAPIMPPAQRHLILSKLDESIHIGKETYGLYTNMSENHVSEGYKYITEFEKETYPVIKFKINDIKVQKSICMIYGRNTVVIEYEIQNGRQAATFTLAPIVNFRDFHQLATNHMFNLKQHVNETKVRLEVDYNAKNPVYMYLNDGRYIEHQNDMFYHMYYLKEDERGFNPSYENHIVPGRFEVDLKPREKKTVTFVASLEENIEEIDSKTVFANEIARIQDVVSSSGLIGKRTKVSKLKAEYNEFLSELLISADSFLISRPNFGTHSVIAGFPWFLDWGRDTLIAYEGLFLVTHKFDLAKEILTTFTRDIKYGLVPNGYSGFDNRPLYNSADASLLLFEAVNKYLAYTKDYEFIKENIYEKLKNIIENYENGINLDNNNIYFDEDGLMCSGTAKTQNTWMDAKIGDFAVTPRNGKVVELNALWYNALKTLEFLSNKFGDKWLSERCAEASEEHKEVFTRKFYNEKNKCLYDVLGDEKIRPNQLFAISTTYPVIRPASKEGKDILKVVKDKLLTKYGVRTLSPDDENYVPVYEGDYVKRDKSYHQGVSWVWLLGLYADACWNAINDEKDRLEKEKMLIEYEIFSKNVYKTFQKEIYKSDGLGSISELYNSDDSGIAGGTIAQAWSVSEIIKIIVRMKDVILGEIKD